jgi:hypothetical protein
MLLRTERKHANDLVHCLVRRQAEALVEVATPGVPDARHVRRANLQRPPAAFTGPLGEPVAWTLRVILSRVNRPGSHTAARVTTATAATTQDDLRRHIRCLKIRRQGTVHVKYQLSALGYWHQASRLLRGLPNACAPRWS